MAPELDDHDDARTTLFGPSASWARLGLGGAQLAGPDAFGPPRSVTGCRDAVVEACRARVALIDTSPAYGPGWSEAIIGRALRGRSDRPWVATKTGVVRTASGGWAVDVDAAAMRAGVERSLRRLGVECLDLLQLHHPSARVPIEDSMGVLNDLRARGLTHHVGVCNVTLTQLRRAEQAGPIATVQNHLHVRRVTPASVRLIEYCASQGVAFLAYQPLAQGLLLTDAALSETAEQRGIGVIEALLGPLLRLADNVIPIPGSGTARHVREIVESYWAHERRAPPRALA